MPTVTFEGRTLDARPDRVDLRDRPYLPRLVSLPPRYPSLALIQEKLPGYRKAGLILDQRNEGACTGFGLAAVINYLFWIDPGRARDDFSSVSARMLYHLARFYDEWPGEDYEGSSCRGAMKGWHRHGVCDERHWPYLDNEGGVGKPETDWETDAATRPLGAYYRVDKDSIVDMQAAIVEVGAIYVSATVHKGWFPAQWERSPDGIAIITVGDPSAVGGHAFALVGYTAAGFIVQNSWGPSWGSDGFAILTYDDWIERGVDAWVAVLGAPTLSGRERKPMVIEITRGSPTAAFWSVGRSPETSRKYPGYEPWDERSAYLKSIVMGNNGVVLNRIPEAENALASLERVVAKEPAKWLNPAEGKTKIVLYAHGGLNDEAASIMRAGILGPYFYANDVYPIFFTWKTGVVETLTDIIQDHVESLAPEETVRGLWRDVKETVQEAKDRLIEAACQELHIKAIWAQMKQNAEAAATEPRPTLGLTVQHLAALKQLVPELDLHVVGHSAGAILLGHLFDVLADPQWANPSPLKVSTCTLFAPATTVAFALKHYVPAVSHVLPDFGAVMFEILTDKREREDSVGPYGKSLLYLISRGLEDHHKTPILGLEKVWAVSPPNEWGSASLARDVANWRENWKGAAIQEGVNGDASDGMKGIPWCHGTFDNDITVITRTVERIAGKKIVHPVEDLSGY